MRCYVDTSIWRDYFEDRRDRIRPLGLFAFRFLKERQKRKEQIIVSDKVIQELLAYYPLEKVMEVFLEFRDIIVEIECTKEQIAEAYSFLAKAGKRVPFADVLHSIAARDSNAVIVSRDAHFREINIVECVAPEEIG